MGQSAPMEILLLSKFIATDTGMTSPVCVLLEVVKVSDKSSISDSFGILK